MGLLLLVEVLYLALGLLLPLPDSKHLLLLALRVELLDLADLLLVLPGGLLEMHAIMLLHDGD